MTSASGLIRKYLHPDELRRLERLGFSPRRRVEGRFAGLHATPQRGKSVEFQDYRPYLPGDEVSRVDWKVYGRSDKLFIKLFEHHAELTVNLLVDASASMAYRGIADRRRETEAAAPAAGGGASMRRQDRHPGRHSKFEYACFLAAAIGFLVARHHDRAALGVANRGLAEYCRPARSLAHVSTLLDVLERTSPRWEARLAEAIRTLAAHSRRRDVLVLFSDLWDEPDAVRHALAFWRDRGGEVVVFHIVHPDEISLPDVEHGVFIDSETASRMRLNLADIRDDYSRRFKRYQAAWAQFCRCSGIDYELCPTSEPYYTRLEHYLGRRAARK